MENLPLPIYLTFYSATALTFFFLWKATPKKRLLILIISSIWLLIQGLIGNSDFYTITDSMPPRFLLLIGLPLALVAFLFSSKRTSQFLDELDVQTLTLLHIVRIPVELVLFWLFQQQMVPELMTFEGRNFDILSGLTAPIIFYFGYVNRRLNSNILLMWNFICLGLLINIVVNAVLSAPFPFQQFAFDQPNRAVLYFPFVWLPCFIVPAVLFSHLVAIRQLLKRKTIS